MRVRVCMALVGLLVGGCKARSHPASPPAVTQSDGAAAPVAHSLVIAREAAIAKRAVDLDRRFTSALGDVARLTGTVACTSTRHGAQTTIACGSTQLEVAELADYEELHDALALSAAHVTWPVDGSVAPAEWLLDSVATGLGRARTAGRAWSTARTRTGALEGLHGLLVTMLAENDAFGLADSIASRALALLVIAERGGPLPRESALLAHLLGYEAASARLASALDPGDPLQGFLTRPLDASARAETSDGATPLALYLAHRALLEAGEAARAASLRAHMGQLDGLTSVHAARLLAPRFREARVLGLLLPWLALADARELARDAPARGTGFEDAAGMKTLGLTDRPQLLRQLAATVAALDKTGPFVEGGLIDDHFRALVASADDVYRADAASAGCASCKSLRIQSDVVGGEQKIEMPELDDGTNTAEASTRPAVYQTSLDWMRFDSLLVRGKSSHRTMPQYLQDAHNPFGLPVEGALQEYWNHVPWGAAVQREVETEVERRADTRPTHRALLATLAFHLYDLARYYELGRSWRAVAGARASALSDLMTIGDGHADRVHALLADSHAPRADRRAAFDALEQAGQLEPADRRTLAALLVQSANASDGTRAIELLVASDPRGAEALCKRWLVGHPEEQGTRTAASVMTVLAGLQEARKDYASALETIGPAISHGGDAAVHRAALIHLDLKDVAGAEALATSNMRTRPDPMSIGIVAEILIRAKHYAAAADLLAAPPVPLDRQAVGWHVARCIVGAFPDEASLAAFADELKRVQFNMGTMGDLAAVFELTGRRDLAFAALALTPAEGYEAVEKVTDAYPNLVASHGLEAGRKWLAESLPPSLLVPFASRVAKTGEVDVLFSVVGDPVADDAVSDLLWATRLVALELHHEGAGPRWDRVMAHYATAKGASHFDTCARYTLGLVPFEAVDRAIDDPSKIPDAGLILGVGALVHGRVADAIDWLQTTVRTGIRDNSSYLWVRELFVQLATLRLGPEALAEKWKPR